MVLKTFILIIVTSMFSLTIRAQTNLSGVINSYSSVQSINYSNPGRSLSSVAGINVSDTLFLIQLKGASINISDNNTYGEEAQYNGAGSF